MQFCGVLYCAAELTRVRAEYRTVCLLCPAFTYPIVPFRELQVLSLDRCEQFGNAGEAAKTSAEGIIPSQDLPLTKSYLRLRSCHR